MNKALIKNSILFVLGCALYLMIEIFYRGYSFRLMGIAGGLIFLIGGQLNNKFSYKLDLLLQCLIIAVATTVIEIIIGQLDYYFLHLNMWDYSNVPFNYFNGKICLPFSAIWFLFGFPIIFLSDALEYYVFKDDEQPYYRIFNKTILQFPKRK